MDKFINHIAQMYLNIETLETRNNESLDFYEVPVWQLKKALKVAYEAGKKDKGYSQQDRDNDFCRQELFVSKCFLESRKDCVDLFQLIKKLYSGQLSQESMIYVMDNWFNEYEYMPTNTSSAKLIELYNSI